MIPIQNSKLNNSSSAKPTILALASGKAERKIQNSKFKIEQLLIGEADNSKFKIQNSKFV